MHAGGAMPSPLAGHHDGRTEGAVSATGGVADIGIIKSKLFLSLTQTWVSNLCVPVFKVFPIPVFPGSRGLDGDRADGAKWFEGQRHAVTRMTVF